MPLQALSRGLARLQEWRFLLLTLVLATWMLLSPRLGDGWLVEVLMQVLLLNCMLVTLWVSVEKRRLKALLFALWGLALAASLALMLPIAPGRGELLGRIEVVCRVPILLACATGILLFVFRRGPITLDSIFAAVVAYLLIAIAFAEAYVFLQICVPESFKFPAASDAATPSNLAGSLMYFSFVTIATLGYGDMLPNTQFARMLVVNEAVVGQFYVAVIVALLVSRFIAQDASSTAAASHSLRRSD